MQVGGTEQIEENRKKASHLTLGFMLVSFAYLIITFIGSINELSESLMFNTHKFINNHSILSMFLSPFGSNIDRQYEVVWIGVNILFLTIAFCSYERRSSTIYAVTDIFLHTFVINSVIFAFSAVYNLYYWREIEEKPYLIYIGENYGFSPLLIIYFISFSKEENRKVEFLFSSIKMPISFYSLPILIASLFEYSNYLVLVISVIIGLLKAKGFDIKMPQMYYVQLEALIPMRIKTIDLYQRDFYRKKRLPLYNRIPSNKFVDSDDNEHENSESKEVMN